MSSGCLVRCGHHVPYAVCAANVLLIVGGAVASVAIYLALITTQDRVLGPLFDLQTNWQVPLHRLFTLYRLCALSKKV